MGFEAAQKQHSALFLCGDRRILQSISKDGIRDALQNSRRIPPSPPKKGTFVYQKFLFCLSIAKALAYHHDAVVDIITEGAYHQP